MYKEKKEKETFVSNRERLKFIKDVNKAFDKNKPLTEEQLKKVKNIFE